jgi:hypothetical protein
MKKHPEPRRGEMFLGNQQGLELSESLKGIEGLRLASPAYDLDGKTITGYFALMASPAAAERYNRIKEAELSAIRQGRGRDR